MMQTSGSITLEIGPAGKLEPIWTNCWRISVGEPG
jgi:hypothetical protein